jgi:hypothetical protein
LYFPVTPEYADQLADAESAVTRHHQHVRHRGMPATGTKSRIRLTAWLNTLRQQWRHWSPLPDKSCSQSVGLGRLGQATTRRHGLVVNDHGLTQSFGHLLTDGARGCR